MPYNEEQRGCRGMVSGCLLVVIGVVLLLIIAGIVGGNR
jgi:hypothetical protein